MITKKNCKFQEDKLKVFSDNANKNNNINYPSNKILNNSYDSKQPLENNNHTQIQEKKPPNLRGRQLNPNNIYTISKKNNSSLATTCESKKRIVNKSKNIYFFI